MDAYILVSGARTIDGAAADDAKKRVDERNEGVIIKICAPFYGCINEINSTQIDHAKDLNVVMPMCNLIEQSDNYSKTSGSLWKCYRVETGAAIVNSQSLKSKTIIAGETPADGNSKDVPIAAPLKYLTNFWKTLEMLLINCKLSLNLTWSEDCVISSAIGKTKFGNLKTKFEGKTLRFSFHFTNSR